MNFKNVFFRSFILIFFFTQFLFSQNLPQSKHFKLQNLADGVYAAIASNSGYAISNAGIIDLGNKTLIFDTFINPNAAEDLLSAARELTGHKISYVVNSHFHNDHIRGNQVFSPETNIISTSWTRNEIAKTEHEEIKWEKDSLSFVIDKYKKLIEDESDDSKKLELVHVLTYLNSIENSLPILKTRLPNITIDDTMKIIGKKRTAILIPMGKGHTESDMILYLPDDKIVFTGDLLFINFNPWLADGFPDDWKRDLRNINRLDANVLVPGHGPVGSPYDLSIMSTYIQSLQDLVKELIKEDASFEDVEDKPIPDEYKNWGFARFFKQNVKFLFELEKEK